MSRKVIEITREREEQWGWEKSRAGNHMAHIFGGHSSALQESSATQP